MQKAVTLRSDCEQNWILWVTLEINSSSEKHVDDLIKYRDTSQRSPHQHNPVHLLIQCMYITVHNRNACNEIGQLSTFNSKLQKKRQQAAF